MQAHSILLFRNAAESSFDLLPHFYGLPGFLYLFLGSLSGLSNRINTPFAARFRQQRSISCWETGIGDESSAMMRYNHICDILN